MRKAAIRTYASWLRSLYRILRWTALILVVGFIGIILILRYWILPDIERYHADITSAASNAVGRPLHIGQIKADWNGLRPRLLLSDVRILDEHGRTALALPMLRNTIAWSTLIAGALRIQTLELDDPALLIRRDAKGHLYVGGILSGEQAGAESAAADSDWLLHQSRIEVHNGRVVWQDDTRKVPAVTFEKVELAIDNRGEHHRFAFSANPPVALASSIDLRGNLYGSSLSELSEWNGEVFAQMDEMDVAAWNKRFILPDALKSGRGGVRIWLGMARGQVTQVDGDISLRDVNAQLSNDLPALDMLRVNGRFGWHQAENGLQLSTRQLSWRMRDGFELKPTDLYLSLSGSKGYQSGSGEIRANLINLADANKIISYVPLSDEWKQRIAQLAPQGQVSGLEASWQGGNESLSRFRLQAQFKGVGIKATEGRPGISGLSGSVEGGDREGTLQLDSHDLNIQAPMFMSEPLVFDKLTARLDWQHNERGWNLKLNNTKVSNADLEGSVSGAYQTNEGPGVADIAIILDRASVKHVARYIPTHALDDQTYHWLQTGLLDGVAESFKMHVKGDLREFPFVDNKNGLFKIEAKAKNVAIEFDHAWPRIDRATTSFLMQGARIEVRAATAMTNEAAVQNVSVIIPDVLANDVVLKFKGEASGPAQRCLDYIRNSPVRGYLDKATDGFKANADGLLKLQLDIPLAGNSKLDVKGSYQFINTEIDLGEQIPQAYNVNGLLTFTGDGLQANDIKAQILGGPARISINSENGGLQTRASGRLNAGNLPPNYTYPLLRHLHGSADWTADVRVNNKLTEVQVASNLVGLVSTLPQPFAKAASDAVKLRFEMRDVNAKQDMMRLRYGDSINAELHRTLTLPAKEWEIQQGDIVLGSSIGKGGKEGIWVTGNLPQFEVEGWNGWSEFSSGEGTFPDIAGINITLGKAYGYGNVVRQLNIRGSARNGLVSTRLTSRELNGDVIWQPQNEGKLLLRLKNAMLKEGGTPNTKVPTSAVIASRVAPLTLPTVDMTIDNLTWKGRSLGKLEMLVKAEDGDIVMPSMRLSSPDGVLSAKGRWSSDPHQTQVSTKIDIINSGKILARYGYEESIKDGSGTLESDLIWHGAPDDLNFGSMDGSLHLKTGKGRFMQVNPGAAKLLGVLSLQSLPKRVSLDFTDVISPGFEFDSIEGEAVIQHGLLKTNEFKMNGAAAKINMNGQVDLERETQKLRVRVMPAIGDNLSLLSFVAGPAVGVSVLLANKILSDPLDKLVSFDYNVTGSWADPKVERVGGIKSLISPSENAGVPAN